MRRTARITNVVGDLKGIQSFEPYRAKKIIWKHTFEK
jgi:hypothetical protein